MNFKDYAPYLEPTIPAFCFGKMNIPFEHNPAVSLSSVKGFKYCIKYLNSTDALSYSQEIESINSPIVTEGWPVGDFLIPGQSYQVQLAYYYADNTVGVYSSAAVAKYIGTSPSVSLTGKINTGGTAEVTINCLNEPITEYRFIGYDPDGAEVINTGWLAHDSSQDIINGTNRISTDKWINNTTIFDFSSYSNKKYQIKYEFKTLNGYQNYKSLDNEFTDFDRVSDQSDIIKISFDDDTGKVSIASISTENNFKLLRTQDPYKVKWDILKNNPGVWFKDHTVESGETYIYAVAGLEEGDIFRKSEDFLITTNFEDIFLSDKDRQLRIRFNPKVSSFRTTMLESKIDTIGGKYPFFFRNGNMEYKEIPISGLISYWMDEQEQFIKWKDLGLDLINDNRESTSSQLDSSSRKIPTTNLTGYNMAAERKMKLEVLNWLNNSKPKLFRSPTEGNYLVRLMNVSLTPEDKLSRMVHSFSATAYECGPTTIESLRENGIISEDDNG